ncbi:hypothetical protein Mfer_0140 [Methanothermus fervidus DSM 2088]|uniref:Uncharacterized protein n=1 Tax=Methanothermus fervidus (strain ATCC 43054 / DSM 2088 / JCM 10308 / V24 S) TaxID=523846 RepID=E3GXB1_METFV|nr:hypothetical protein [Methanothermus fervidus]ADP76943.1 hypothetical protein Mfer_0140 [Methanothermus fervidus DSM 2088]
MDAKKILEDFKPKLVLDTPCNKPFIVFGESLGKSWSIRIFADRGKFIVQCIDGDGNLYVTKLTAKERDDFLLNKVFKTKAR